MTDLVTIRGKKTRPVPEDEFFEDQILFFTRAGNNGREVQKQLSKARVVVFGAGTVGSHAFTSLAESGVGTLRVLDDAEATEAELKAAALSNGGGPKGTRAQALALRARQTGGAAQSFDSVSVDVHSATEVARVIAGADCVMVCSDAPSPSLFRSVNQASLKTGVKWLAGQIYGGLGIVGPTVIPGRSACYKCYEVGRNASLPNAREIVLYETRLSEMSAIINPRVAPKPLGACVGGLLALEALRLITGLAPPQTVGRFLRVDFFSPEMTYHPILRVPLCPACGAGALRP